MSTLLAIHGIILAMPYLFRSFFSIMILLVTSALFLLTIIRLAGQIIKEKNKKCPGIIAYVTSVYLIHLFSFLNLSWYDTLPLFNRPDSILSLLFLLSRFSLFVTVPTFIHSLFPHPWTIKVQLAYIVMGVGLLIGSVMEILPSIPYTIGMYSVLVLVGVYAVIHGFISSIHIPTKEYLSSFEFRYGLVALISFLVSIPFLIPMDLTLIPQGFLDSRYAFYPYHSLLLIGGFFLASTIKNGYWLKDTRTMHEAESPLEQGQSIIKEYGLTTRETQIYKLLLEHNSYKDIANTLNISMPTAKTHIINLYRKLDINKKSELPGLQGSSALDI